MKKIYEVDWDFKGEIVVELDESQPDKLISLMHEVNSFWSGHKQRLDDEDGDIKAVFLKMLCEQCLLTKIQGGFNLYGVIKEFDDLEGWPPIDGSQFITLKSIVGVEFSYSDMVIKTKEANNANSN